MIDTMRAWMRQVDRRVQELERRPIGGVGARGAQSIEPGPTPLLTVTLGSDSSMPAGGYQWVNCPTMLPAQSNDWVGWLEQVSGGVRVLQHSVALVTARIDCGAPDTGGEVLLNAEPVAAALTRAPWGAMSLSAVVVCQAGDMLRLRGYAYASGAVTVGGRTSLRVAVLDVVR